MINYEAKQSTKISTEQFAEEIGIKAQSVRVRLCETGSYFGIIPTKLPNGRLRWPENPHKLLSSYIKPNDSSAKF